MAVDVPSSVLTSLGLTRDAERLYYQVAPTSGKTIDAVAQLLQSSREELLTRMTPLLDIGPVALTGEKVVVPPMALVVADLVREESGRASTVARRLDALARAVPHLVAAATRPAEADVSETRPIEGELSSGGNPLELIGQMLRTSRGDMLWLRPDAWAMPRGVGGQPGARRGDGRRTQVTRDLSGPCPQRGPRGAADARARASRSGSSRSCRHGCSSSGTRTPCSPNRSATPTSRGSTSGNARWSRP
ncbi:hypothetical protein [Nocardioides sp. B-3]|uniref:hypothetical protein n=1 Tax=Nocardioides sp. B-3 TaxID=2895565 RepID=UPI0021538936|nr:hypothetical protein [Nocardioides sp. B-3]UUZ61524.1 hypothetical protein LP418_13770 [Nocardioides sp. B-3]